MEIRIKSFDDQDGVALAHIPTICHDNVCVRSFSFPVGYDCVNNRFRIPGWRLLNCCQKVKPWSAYGPARGHFVHCRLHPMPDKRETNGAQLLANF
jgi:hypothetical protein